MTPLGLKKWSRGARADPLFLFSFRLTKSQAFKSQPRTGHTRERRTGPDTQRAQAHNHTQNSNSRTQPRHTSRSHAYAWHAEARVEGCLDRTVYGASRTATTSFFTHHLRLTASSRSPQTRSDRRGAPLCHLGEIQEISPP